MVVCFLKEVLCSVDIPKGKIFGTAYKDGGGGGSLLQMKEEGLSQRSGCYVVALIHNTF